MTSFDYYLITASLFVTALGGAVAYFKRDYITRGMAICFFTSLWGVLAMVLSPSSKAEWEMNMIDNSGHHIRGSRLVAHF